MISDSAILRRRHRHQTPFQWTVYGLVSILGHILVGSLVYWMAEVQVAGTQGTEPAAIDVIELTASAEELLAQLPERANDASPTADSSAAASAASSAAEADAVAPDSPSVSPVQGSTIAAAEPASEPAQISEAPQASAPQASAPPAPAAAPTGGWRNPFKGLSPRRVSPVTPATDSPEDYTQDSTQDSTQGSTQDPDSEISETIAQGAGGAEDGSGSSGDRPPADSPDPIRSNAGSASANEQSVPGNIPGAIPEAIPGAIPEAIPGTPSPEDTTSPPVDAQSGSAADTAPLNPSLQKPGVGGVTSRETETAETAETAETTAPPGPESFNIALSVDSAASYDAYGGQDLPTTLAVPRFQQLSISTGSEASPCSELASQLSARDVGHASEMMLIIDADRQGASILQPIDSNSAADDLLRCVITTQWEFQPARGENGKPKGESLLVIRLSLN